MKNLLIILVLLSTTIERSIAQQVPLNTIVEHFTNTKCSVCASKNPGFYSNLNSQTNITYLSIHPSSPYPTCPLSIQNKVDNDSRTNYYGIFGATPRIVINGNVLAASTNYSLASIFTPYVGLTSSFVVSVTQNLLGPDSINTKVIIKKVDVSAFVNASLFIGLAEDTVYVNGGNGELVHYSVLRKSPNTSNGISISLPSLVGDSIIFTINSKIESFWSLSRIFSLAILQDASTKNVIQTNKSKVLDINTTDIEAMNLPKLISFYPNPTTQYLNVEIENKSIYKYEIYSMQGAIIQAGQLVQGEPINLLFNYQGDCLIKVIDTNSKLYFTKYFLKQ